MTDIDFADIEHRAASLDGGLFAEAAAWASRRLYEHGSAYLALEPGDCTSYRIMIIAPSGEMWSGRRTQGDYRYYHVALSFGLGYGYDWAGHDLEPSYVATKWTHNQNGTDYYTACVLTRFLNALAALWKDGGTA